MSKKMYYPEIVERLGEVLPQFIADVMEKDGARKREIRLTDHNGGGIVLYVVTWEMGQKLDELISERYNHMSAVNQPLTEET